MATTRIIAMHKSRNMSLSKTLKGRIDYAENPLKTNNKELVSTYMCDKESAYKEFELSKTMYMQKTGRKQKNDIIAYQVRQAFKPNEVTPEKANEIGYELASKITKGNHAFVVATHIDKEHIHNHIIWNSTNLDCSSKYRDVKRSAKNIALMSDILCVKHNLTVVEEKSDNSVNYNEWIDDKKKMTISEKIRIDVEECILQKPKDFEKFISMLKEKGYDIKRGKHIAVKSKEQQRFKRLSTLGKNFSEEKLKEFIEGKEKFETRIKVKPQVKKLGLLYDVKNQFKDNKDKHYGKFTKIKDIKDIAKTIEVLTEKENLNFENLQNKIDVFDKDINKLKEEIKVNDKEIKARKELVSEIINYTKTKSINDKYKASGYSKTFKIENEKSIVIHQKAKKCFADYFEKYNVKKLPKKAFLEQEISEQFEMKSERYSKIRALEKERNELVTAKKNAEYLYNKPTEKRKNRNENSR